MVLELATYASHVGKAHIMRVCTPACAPHGSTLYVCVASPHTALPNTMSAALTFPVRGPLTKQLQKNNFCSNDLHPFDM